MILGSASGSTRALGRRTGTLGRPARVRCRNLRRLPASIDRAAADIDFFENSVAKRHTWIAIDIVLEVYTRRITWKSGHAPLRSFNSSEPSPRHRQRSIESRVEYMNPI